MKFTNLKFILFTCLFIGLAFTACKNNKTTDATETTEETTEEAEVDETSAEYASAFICPMHCKGSGSAEAGVCPVCGMDYEKNENYKAPEGETHSHDGHDHDHDHGDHNHKHDQKENK